MALGSAWRRLQDCRPLLWIVWVGPIINSDYWCRGAESRANCLVGNRILQAFEKGVLAEPRRGERVYNLGNLLADQGKHHS